MVCTGKSQKDQNILSLTGLTLLYLFSSKIAVEGSLEWLLTLEFNQRLLIGLFVPSLGSIVSIFLIGQIDPVAKARLIYWRWDDPLPGSEAFSRWMKMDSRIDETQVKLKHGPLPVDRKSQNILWYKMYRAVANEISVSDASKHYLFFRDATLVTLIVGFICSIIVIVFSDQWASSTIYVSGYVFAVGLAYRAARLAGFRLVKQVLTLNPDIPQPRKSNIIV